MVTVQADRQALVIPKFFKMIDDDDCETVESFAIVAEIGQDVPDNFNCFQTGVGQTTCYGRHGATEIRIIDNDCEFL